MPTIPRSSIRALCIAALLALLPFASATAANVILQNATATWSQGGASPTNAIDGVTTGNGGWAILKADTSTTAETAVFETATDVGFPRGSTLTFTLRHNSANPNHTIGRFRISITTDNRSTFADGLNIGGDVTANWTVLNPYSAVSANGATLTGQSDLSILASGTNAATDTFTMIAREPFTGIWTRITGVRLEVMADVSLPTSGPGRASPSGNFTLTEFTMAIEEEPPLEIETEFPAEPYDEGTWWHLTATGGNPFKNFSISAGALPPGIEVSIDGTIYRDPNVTPVLGRYSFTVAVFDTEEVATRAFTFVEAQEVPVPEDVVAWFPGELHAHDVVGGALGLETGGATFARGLNGRAFSFDGIDDSIEVNSDALNQLPLTIEAWIKPQQRTDGSAADFFPPNIVSGDRPNFGGHGLGVNVFPDGSHMWIELQTTNPAQAFHEIPGVSFTAGQWSHVALVLTPGNAKTYVNGELVDDFAFTQGAMDASALYRIGRHSEDTGFGTKRFFKGLIDEVSIYANALSAAQVLGIYNADSRGKARDDGAREFSSVTNDETKLWQYGYMAPDASPRVSTFVRYQTTGEEDVIRAWDVSGTPNPNVKKNPAETSYLHWLPGRLSALPGSGQHFSAVRWTAPAAGTYAVFSEFARLSTQPGNVSVYVRHKSVVMDDFLAGAGARAQLFTLITAAAGDTVDFIVGVGDFYGLDDDTGLTPSIVLVGAAPSILTVDFPAPGGALTAAGGTPGAGGSYTWQILGAGFPPHLSLSSSGVVSLNGQPQANGSYTFTVRATDANGLSTDKEFTIVVAGGIPHASGIVAWWPGEDAVGEIIGGRHGSLKNGATFGAGKVGRAFAFDGTNDFVEVADHDSLDITGDLTIEAWVNATAAGGERTIVSKRSPDNLNVTYVLFLRDGMLRFASRTAGGAFFDVGLTLPVPSGLRHVAVTISGTTLKLYISGVWLLQTTCGVRPATTGPLTIGAGITTANPASSPAGPFGGVIDELAIYNRALTDAEIAAIHLAGASGKARDDAGRQFSLTPQVAGRRWTYGQLPGGAIDTTRFVLNNTPWTDGTELAGWIAPAPSGVIGINTTDNLVIRAGARHHPPHQVLMHPSTSAIGEPVVVRWTAPEAGRYAVSATFLDTDTEGGAIKGIEIYHGTTALFTNSISGFMGDGKSVTLPRTVAAGETVDFIVTRGTDNTAFSDLAGLFASVVHLGPALPALTIDQTAFPEKPLPPQPGSPPTPWKLTASNASGTSTFAVISGQLPPAIAIDADGNITGELTGFGHFKFTVEVTDAAGEKARREYQVVVALEVAPPSDIIAWFPGELHPHDVVNGAPGVATGGVTFARGLNGRAFVFDGVDDSVEVTSDETNRVPLTIEAWIKPELRTDGVAADFFPPNIVSGDRRNFGGHGFGVNVFPDGSHLWIDVQHATLSEGFRQIPDVAFAAGEWAHVALVLSPGNAKTYVNGVLKDDFTFTQGSMDGETFYRIGRHNEDTGYGAKRFFKGAIDEVSIYRRALTGAEILGIYNADSLGKTRDDAARDFFSTTNANTQRWQYGQMSTGTSPTPATFTRYAEAGTENAINYWSNLGQSDPNVIKNVTEATYLHWLPGRLSAHPGPGGHYSAVRWTAPASGTYAVFSEFSRLNAEAGNVKVHVRLGSLAPHEADLSGQGSPSRFFGTVIVKVNDKIDFIVGDGGASGFDATGLTPSIVQLSGPPPLAAATGLKIATGAPAKTHQKFTFSALNSETAAGVALALQFTTTPGTEASWASLGAMKKIQGSAEWRLITDPIPLAAGDYFFRVVTSATEGAPVASAVFGANAIVGGDIAATGPLTIAPAPAAGVPVSLNIAIGTKKKVELLTPEKRTGKQSDKWTFTVKQEENHELDSLAVVIQYSTTPDVAGSWQNLEGATLDRSNIGTLTWAGDTSALPAGTLYFRTLTTADGHAPSASAPSVAFIVRAVPILKIRLKASTASDVGNGLTVRQGEKITYRIEITNEGSVAAEDLVFDTKIPLSVSEYRGSTDEGISGYMFKGPVSFPTSKIRTLTWKYSDLYGSLAPGATAVGTFNVDLTKFLTRGNSVYADYVRVQHTLGKSYFEGETKTELIDAISATLVADKAIAVRGEEVEYTMTITNEYATTTVTEVSALANIPRGMALVKMNTGTGGNFDEAGAALTDPTEVSNPSASPYYFGVDRILRWKVGSIGPRSARTIKYTLQVQHDVPTTETDKAGVSHTPEFATLGWNVRFTPPSGGFLDVFRGAGTPCRVLLSGENLVSPPVLLIEKLTTGDGFISNDPDWSGNVTAVRVGEFLDFKLQFRNLGNGAARHVQIQERLAGKVAGHLVFETDACKISRNGGPEQPLGFTAYRYFDATGKLLSGEPLRDGFFSGVFHASFVNGRYDPGEDFVDLTGDKKYTPPGNLAKAEIIVFDLGEVPAFSTGYVRYRCRVTAPVGTLIKSDGYVLVSESLRSAIGGSPNVTFARVVPDLSFQVETAIVRPVGLNAANLDVAPNDVADDPGTAADEAAGSKLTFEINYRNTSHLNASSVPIQFTVPEGISLDGTAELFGSGALEIYRLDEVTGAPPNKVATPAVTMEIKGRMFTFKPALNAGQAGLIRIRCIAYSTAQLPAKLKKLNALSEYKATIPPISFVRPASSLRQAAGFALASLPATVTGKSKEATVEGSLRFGDTNRPHLYGLRIAPLSQETLHNLSYMLVAGNSGRLPAKNVSMKFFIPPGTDLVDVTHPYKRAGDIITMSIGDLGSGSAVGVVVTVNIAHIRKGSVTNPSFLVTSDNCWNLDFASTGTTVRDRPFHVMFSEIFTRPIAFLGAQLSGGGTAGFQNDLNTLAEDALFIRSLGATIYASSKSRLRIVPLGDGGLLTIAPIGVVSGGSVVASAHNTEIRVGVGREMSASGHGAFHASKVDSVVVQARQKIGWNIFVGGSGRGIDRSGTQRVNNDTGEVLGAVSVQSADMVAAGGGNMVAAGAGNILAPGGLGMVAAGAGNLVGNDGGSLVGNDGAGMVAAGSLNMVAAGAGNVIAVSGGDMVAAGSLNLVAAGAGNLVAAGAGNMVAAGAGNMVAAGAGNLVGNDGAGVVPTGAGSIAAPKNTP